MIEPINANIRGLAGYVPGEQPAEPGWIKLNTNENPYPPAPEVADAIRSFEPDRVRLYPPPDAPELRRLIGETLGWPPENILITNGSDEALRMICHAFLNPRDRVGMLAPTYTLYPILGRLFGAEIVESPVGPEGEWPERLEFQGVKVFFIANPNPPYGTFYSPEQIATVVASHPDVLFVIDEAYVEFAPNDCLGPLHELDNILIVRTFSKSRSLAGLRVGFVLGHGERMAPLWVVRDSYNVNALSQAAAEAAWEAGDYYEAKIAQVVAERKRASARLAELGFRVLPSGGNFIFARHAEAPRLFGELKERRILVRHFDAPPTRDGLRITIGTPEQMDSLAEALRDIIGRTA